MSKYAPFSVTELKSGGYVVTEAPDVRRTYDGIPQQHRVVAPERLEHLLNAQAADADLMPELLEALEDAKTALYDAMHAGHLSRAYAGGSIGRVEAAIAKAEGQQ